MWNDDDEGGGCACECPRGDWSDVNDHASDGLDALVLCLARFVMVGHAGAGAVALEEGLASAIDLLGAGDGPVVFGHVLALVRGLRLDRRQDFEFLGTRCRSVSADDAALMALVGAARRLDESGFVAATAALTGSGDGRRLASAARTLAGVLGAPLTPSETPRAAATHKPTRH
jgi:hypothetical protein